MWQGNVLSASVCVELNHTEPCPHSGQKCFLQKECIPVGYVPPGLIDQPYLIVSSGEEGAHAMEALRHIRPGHMCPPAMHTPCHTCPLPCIPPAMHAPPCTPLSTSPFTMQPPSPCMCPFPMHACPPLWTEFSTRACKIITFP